MRFLHTGDWHLGARLGNQDRLPDQFERLEEICRHLDEKEVDVLLVAGDVFDEHRSEALARIIARLARLLKPRIEAGMWAVFIAGNHDREHVFPLIRGLQDLVTAEGSSRVIFTERPALVPVTARSGEQARLPDGQVQLMLLPYPTPTRYDLPDPPKAGWPSPDAKRQALAQALRERIGELSREARLTPGVPVVLCGHFLVRGVREGFYQLSEQEDVPVEPADLPAYAYIALGHIHKPQTVGAPHIRYCGSLERMDRGEADDRKMVLLADVGREGLRDLAELPLNATPFAHVSAASEEDLERAAKELLEPARTLVSLSLDLSPDEPVGPLLARARALFPRLWTAPEIRLLETAAPPAPPAIDRRDVAGTVWSYLQEALADDPDREELLRLAEELLAEPVGAVRERPPLRQAKTSRKTP
jgi:exonuclease SbcD